MLLSLLGITIPLKNEMIIVIPINKSFPNKGIAIPME